MTCTWSGGGIERAPDGLFEGEEAVMHLIERIVGPLGLRVDESSPWADARLPNGRRVETGSETLDPVRPLLTLLPAPAGKVQWQDAVPVSVNPLFPSTMKSHA